MYGITKVGLTEVRIKIDEMRVDGDGELRMRHRKQAEGSKWCDRGTYNGQERNIYIESEERQTKTHQAREVRDRASPDRSHKTDETSGMDLTQEERRSNGVGSGMSVVVGNRLDTRERKG